MNINKFLEEIKSADLSKLSYSKITSLIKYNSIRWPYTSTIIKKGTFVERGRVNEGGVFYNSEFEISYRTDVGNIKEFGRANMPFTSRFYGAMASKEIKLPIIVLFSELVEQFRNRPTSDLEIIMTVGKWFVKEDLEVADICYSQKYFNIEEIKKRYEYWASKLRGTEIGQEEYQKTLSFFSDEFARTDINNHHDYKLSCLYADFAIGEKLHGIMYPSVKTEYKANNIVLTRNAVEQFLELKQVAMFKYQIKNGSPIVIQTHHSDNLGSFNTNFTWEKVDTI